MKLNRRSLIALSGAAATLVSAPGRAEYASDNNSENPNGSNRVFVLIEIKAVPGKEDDIRQTFVHTIRTSHKPGILSAQIFEHAGEPGRFYSLQEWESDDAFQQHMSDSSDGLDSHLAMLEGKPLLTILKSLG